ncbi:asparagine synthase (glutamine-hydrolyzing) [Amycolatopsis sp. NBC_01488]|uniref:asparagine synthase (glutamine-hydrolyzing) n=1 Tax=Amycolatopsis sp. NBC_01488 TaxID=2903563 RepID=UPI002E2AFBB6|nr:asparagine synthase (glutamine-hydrolyzing) [Amycolatopsis sp. NBC_01488]
MCGIAGWVDFSRDLTKEYATVQAMTRTLKNRGPDAEGIWTGRHVALGHRRLAIIDVVGGAQPMEFTENDRQLAVLTFSGEIFNFRELRAELRARGHHFHTRSDTEVLLHAYLEWGTACVDRLLGMYAFAVWDARREELVMVRDHMGVKPLFYLETPHGVLFGSEPKAILANPMAPCRTDLDGFREMFDMVKTPEETVYVGMREVRPGHLVRVNANGIVKQRYWSLEAKPHTDDLPETIGHVRGLLEDIVYRELNSDVPLCTLLSGGLDSSAVTALAAKNLGRGEVRSFSVDFAGAEYGFEADAVRGSADAPFAREVAEFVSSRHTEILLDSANLVDPAVRAAVLYATDRPPAYWGDMWPSLYLLFRAIRLTSTVALSGESADELFGGYRWFHNPNAIKAETFPWLTSGSSRYFGGIGLLNRGLVEKLDLGEYRRQRYSEAMAEVPRLPGEPEHDRKMREITYLNLTRFVQTLLDRKDLMSMAASLEVRVPFCDHRLVEYVFNVPWQMKSFDGREKSLLRAASANLLPTSVLERVKTPYPATQDPLYEAALQAELREVLSDLNAPVRPLLDLDKAQAVAVREAGAVSRAYDRGSLEMALWLNRWLTANDVMVDL